MSDKDQRVGATRLSSPGPAQSRSALDTRAALVCAAEVLFATHGVDNATLAQIHRGAGQRNNSAIPYHFGDLNGLITAILEKHAPRLHKRFAELLAETSGKLGEPTRDDVTRAQVRATMDRLGDPDGGLQFILIVAQLAGHPEFSSWCVWDLIRRSRGPMLVLGPGRGHASLRTGPAERMQSIVGHNLIVHSIADYARMQECDDPSMPAPDVFVERLVLASVAAANALSLD